MSIGTALAEARRQSELTITQVSRQTRIRESIIAAIEQGDFSACGGDFYARGHIRSIAGVVGIDPVPLIREYDEEHGTLGELRAAEIFEPATPIRIREPRPLHLGRVLVAALLAVIGFGVYHFVSTPAESAAKATPAVTVTEKAPASPAAKPKAKPSVSRASGVPKGLEIIRLTATSDCWVGLTSTTTGKKLYAGVVAAGQSLKWDEKKAVSLTIGNPPGVRLSVNGKTEQMNTVQVVTLSIDPHSSTPVTVG